MKDKKFDPKDLHPETLALSLGYDPVLSEGSIKPPVFLTSTFQFASAEDGKRFFEVAYGLRKKDPGETDGLIYSRINNPNLQIFEERMAAWDGTEKGAAFSSGMAAISTALFTFLRPGDAVLTTSPVYGGTHYLFHKIFPQFGIHVHQVKGGDRAAELLRAKAGEIGHEKIRLIYVETPANPSNVLTDIQSVADVARELSKGKKERVLTMVDNTFLGPLFQQPAKHGADLVVYSATKFIGGHSDLIAGVITGPQSLIDPIIGFRTILGTVATPFSGWLLLRSLETLSVRMRRQAKTAKKIALFLREHPKIKAVYYPGLLTEGPQFEIYKKNCDGPGSLVAFEIKGGEREAYTVLNRFKICRLAVSLGGTESLVEHPMTMTHSDVPKQELEEIGVSPGMIRMSVGIEHETDLLRDLKMALAEN